MNFEDSTQASASLPGELRVFIFMHRYVIPIGTAALLLASLGFLLVASRLGALGSPEFYFIVVVFGVIMAIVSAGAVAAKKLHERESGALRSMKGWLLLVTGLTVASMALELLWPSDERDMPGIVGIASLVWCSGWFLYLGASRRVKEMFAGTR